MIAAYPVTLFIFKRHKTTTTFLDLIAASGTKKIYIFADGPRNDQEKFETEAVKSNVIKFAKTNPTIKLITNFSMRNLGLKNSIVQGLSKVFAREDATIILEDDCLPTLDFFRFSREMLTKYKNDSKVMSITGTSVGQYSRYSYDFAKYPQCWGWATWKRAWAKYDQDIKTFNTDIWKRKSRSIFADSILRWYWQKMLELTKVGQISTWDFQWSYAHFMHDGLAIIPSVNLITNIGFDNHATNTKTWSPMAAMPTSKLKWPIKHPPAVVDNTKLSSVIGRKFYKNPIALLGMIRQYWRAKIAGIL